MADEAPRNHVEFYIEAQPDEKASREQNRPVFKDVEMVRMRFPGDNKRTLVAPANEKYRRDRVTNEWVTYREDYPEHYKLFLAGKEQAVIGTPLSELTFLTEARRAELRALNIHTAEQLAEVDGAALSKLGMYARSLKDQAQAYLDKAAGGAGTAKLAADNEALRNEVESMKNMMAELRTALQTPLVVAAHTATQEVAPNGLNAWDDADLKAFIKDKTGAAPRGNPSHATLVSMAEAANQKQTEAA